MRSILLHVVVTKIALRFGKLDLALRLISHGLNAAPSVRAEMALRVLEGRTAERLGDARRLLSALERGFALAAKDTSHEQGTQRLRALFDHLATGKLQTVRSAKIGEARIFVATGKKKGLRLIGLCPDVSSGWAQEPVRLFFEDRLVSETRVRSIPGAGGRGDFEFRITRSTYARLAPRAVTLEVGGIRRPIIKKHFRSQWPKGFKSRAVTHSQLLARLQSGHILGGTGSLALPKNTDESWLRTMFGLYDQARAWFKVEYGYDLYPVGGTLLGYARTGEVISFDSDFDTGYLSKHTNPEDIRREYKEIILRLLERGVDVRILTGSKPPKIRRDYFWYGDGQHHIDVFVGAFINGKYRRPTFVDTQLTPDDFFPFERKKMNGYDIIVPKEVEKKVAAVYGPGWRKPDPSWKKVRSPEILAYREQIGLTAADLLDIAAASPQEGPLLKQLVEADALESI